MALSLLYLHGTGQRVRSDEWYDALTEAFVSFGLDPLPLDSPRLVVPDYVDLLKNPPERSRRIDFPTETPRPRDTGAAPRSKPWKTNSVRPGSPARENWTVSPNEARPSE